MTTKRWPTTTSTTYTKIQDGHKKFIERICFGEVQAEPCVYMRYTTSLLSVTLLKLFNEYSVQCLNTQVLKLGSGSLPSTHKLSLVGTFT